MKKEPGLTQQATGAGATPAMPLSPLLTEKSLVDWIKANRVKGTADTYSIYVNQFHAFCEKRGVPALPAAPATVGHFLRYLHEERGLARNTTNVAASAIASEYKLTGLQSPTQSELVKATKAVLARKAKPAKQKEPLTLELLRRMVEDAKEGDWIDARDNFMLALLLAAMLRESEEMALKADDVWVEEWQEADWKENKEVLFVFVEKSKTDQERNGHTIVVGPGEDEKTCPVRLFKRWSELRDAKSGFLFHQRGSTKRLSRKTPNSRLHVRLERIGVDSTPYGSHSGRIGGATGAAAAGVAERVIKKHAGWKSDVVHRYIRESMQTRLLVSAATFRPRESAVRARGRTKP